MKEYGVGTHLNCTDMLIQMGTHNICLFKEVDKKYSSCILKTTELLDYVLIGVCVVITCRLYMVDKSKDLPPFFKWDTFFF